MRNYINPIFAAVFVLSQNVLYVVRKRIIRAESHKAINLVFGQAANRFRSENFTNKLPNDFKEFSRIEKNEYNIVLEKGKRVFNRLYLSDLDFRYTLGIIAVAIRQCIEQVRRHIQYDFKTQVQMVQKDQ